MTEVISYLFISNITRVGNYMCLSNDFEKLL
jgi:hypothetical protein